jgi:hypothetical protein
VSGRKILIDTNVLSASKTKREYLQILRNCSRFVGNIAFAFMKPLSRISDAIEIMSDGKSPSARCKNSQLAKIKLPAPDELSKHFARR